ncbi:MAG TPA: potassium-transporting ATPase subunit KdpA [Lysinibacillus sp.]|jgi:K+-transporting ATPase ATPase A chain|uniref:Potassium-transporting ATPase potassium-binding subunit n=1 Tax=Lysinibacillus fusiformis TaxID=28031 RepID=A0A2I0V106_9BACI|nr:MULTISPECIES: potassium-transporting ATPase subunit KdpA [Lysinibacillus]HBT72834.1 potassium-transporting ATPase subunit KdpA [Lysinibacillus sp.]KUF34161.1 K+-transporting ATPase subunit A [Lysinibacillus sp. F5]MEE3805926.1 potassium-transporting ATPase subunit KdpA [Lysinibacillus fusiformis]PKU51987.1 potassium-transporting ATPase subunit KdpA [Lysinibacillus fusiformis]SCY75860.1 K+-transporting ATPase ATPase A chain [Lysinibacillus sp. SG9]
MWQIAIVLIIYLPLVILTGHYLYRVTLQQKTWLDPLLDKVDAAIYKVCGIKRLDMTGKEYVLSLIISNAMMVFVGYIILRIQALLFLNPNNIDNMEATLSFNTIISFITNTNLQHYSGESGLSYLSQMLVITFMMFTSAATGYAACMAFCRRLVAKTDTIGNFFVDFVRVITRILMPFSIVVALILVSQGSPQTFNGNQTVQTIEGKLQDIALGPIASLESIKHIGTNGGGFNGANSTTPFENPTVLSNIVEMLSMMLLPGACVVAFSLMVAYRKEKTIFGKQGLAIFTAMSILFLVGLVTVYIAEKAGNPFISELGITQELGSMEGKEIRFGVAQSALFTTVTTAFTTGSINNMHDTLTPLGGLVPMFNMMLNVVFGGKGVGLMNMMMYVLLTIFIACLMIGRSPQFLGKKIEEKEMKLIALCILIHPAIILLFSALAVATPSGIAGITNPGAHGLSQVLYEFASASANNGSGFEGLADNSTFWNITTGFAMFFGRYVTIIIQLAIASLLANKVRHSDSVGTLKTDTTTFTFLLVAVVLMIGALTFLPALALGPITEHLQLYS